MKPITRPRWLLLLLLLTAGGLNLASGQITPSDDAYTDTGSPGTNFGAKTTVGVVSPSQTTYLTFDLSSIPSGYTSASIAKATLKLYVNTVTAAGSMNVVFVNGAWSEKTITANLAPALGTTIAGSVPVAKANAKDYILIDITPAVGAWLDGAQANDGIALVPNSPLSATFDSKENTTNSHPGELDIVYTSSGGGTITGITTSASSGLVGGTDKGVANLSLLTNCSSGQLLAWNGSAWACKTVNGSGTVTSVGLSAPASDFSVSGSPVTTSGTLNFAWNVAPTTANTANAIVKRDATGSFSAGTINASGQILVSNATIVNPILSQASAPGASAIVGEAGPSTTTTRGVFGMNFSSGIGSAGVQGTDSNTTNAGYTTGMLGLSVNPAGIGVLGMFGTNGSKVGQGRLGTAGAGVWADGPGFGLVATSDLNAIVAYNNHPSGATIYGENDTSASNGLLLYATAPNVQSNGSPANCGITTHADLACTGDIRANGALRAGGDATQSRPANGLVKALVYVDPFQPAGSQIVRCYNSLLAEPSASTPPCGFTINHLGLGYVDLNLGFLVSDRFVQITPVVVNGDTYPVGAQLDGVHPHSDSEIIVSTFYTSLNVNWATDTPFFVTVF